MKPGRILYPALAALLAVACGGDTVSTSTEPSDPAADEPTIATGESSEVTSAPDTEGRLEAVLSIDGTEYRLSLGDVSLAGLDSTYPTRCDPDFMGSRTFTVIATAADEAGVRTDPNVNLSLSLPHDAASPAGAEFELSDDASSLVYVLATDDGLSGAGSPEFDGELGSWTVDGNRITGEVTVFESDHVREFFTATFEIVCPAD